MWKKHNKRQLVERAERIKAGERFERKRVLMTPRQPSSRLFAGVRSVDLHEEIRRNGRRSEAATITDDNNDKHSRASVSETTAVFAHLIRAIIIIRGLLCYVMFARRGKLIVKTCFGSALSFTSLIIGHSEDETIDTHVAIIFARLSLDYL